MLRLGQGFRLIFLDGLIELILELRGVIVRRWIFPAQAFDLVSHELIIVPVSCALRTPKQHDLLHQGNHGLIGFVVAVELLGEDAGVLAWARLPVVLLIFLRLNSVAGEAVRATLGRAARTLQDLKLELHAHGALEVVGLYPQRRGDVVVTFGYLYTCGRHV